MRIGIDRVISQADTITSFAMQIGVTRIGSGGRVMPRSKRGAMTTVENLVASEIEPVEAIELVSIPNPKSKPAPLARFVVCMTALVVCYQALATWVSRVSAKACEIIARVGSWFSLDGFKLGHVTVAVWRGR